MKSVETKSTTPSQPLQAKKEESNNPFFIEDKGSNVLNTHRKESHFFDTNTLISTKHQPFFNGMSAQAKLTIGLRSGDNEKVADAKADKVAQRLAADDHPSTPAPQHENIQRKPISQSEAGSPEEETVQTKCEACDQEEKVQKMEIEEEEKPVQAKPEYQSSPTDVESTLNSTKGGGSALPNDARNQMEGAFGVDFSGVRIHTNSTAVQMNQRLGAQAFTHGNDIYFNTRKYSPRSTEGQKLLGHELTHTVQQGKSPLGIQKEDGESNLDRLNEMLNRWNIPEEDVIQLCSQLSPSEKREVLSGGYRNRMASALDIGEMIRAVNHLGPSLKVKLEWVDQAALFTFMINYLDISEMVRQASTEERRELKNETWKTFFVAVCNNQTMVTALDDLQYDLVTKLSWLDAEVFDARMELNYSTIKPWIVHPNTTLEERESLKTEKWKNFFVSICTNQTMVEALDDLQFDLITKLTWLQAEVFSVRVEIDYATIKPWILHPNTSQVERDSLKTEYWKNFFVSVCTNETMVEALDDLQYDLINKLIWLNSEMTITSWELEYASIKPWITNASQAERDLLKTHTLVGMSFFVKVCTNDTMVEALTDLQFDLKTKLEWVMMEGCEYAQVKNIIVPAADKATVLVDQPFMRSLMDYFSNWDDFAKVTELLGRSCPSGGQMIADANVQAALGAAWVASNPQITNWSTFNPAQPPGHPCQPPPPPPAYLAHEEGGFIYLNLITGGLSTSAVASGGQAALPLSGPPVIADSIVVGGYHTHPNVGNCWGAPFFSGSDIAWSNTNGVPLLMRGAFPAINNTSDHATGNVRSHLAGNRGLPGSGGGIAPQATIDGKMDEL